MMEETVVNSIPSIYGWAGPKPGMTLLDSCLGSLVVTSERLMFLSSGGANLGKSAVAGAVLGVAGTVLADRSTTKKLDFSALDNKGSLAVPLDHVISLAIKRRMDFSAFLTIEFQDENGQLQTHAFMTKFGRKKKIVRFQEAIENAKAGFAG
jgi:hypothetical protein